MSILSEITDGMKKKDLQGFRPGDTVAVTTKLKEGDKEKKQTFTGIVIARAGSGIGETFIVRRVSYGVGVERTFPVNSPVITSIKVTKRGKVRRAKLYYLRGRQGKAARIKSA
jgi:large subunit ribosomal protein L19